MYRLLSLFLPVIIATMLKALIQAMRPRQWAKNVFILAALVFDGQLFRPGPLLATLAGLAVLCIASSAVYLINDLADLEADRQHPEKRLRPIAAGRLPQNTAWAAAILLLVTAAVTGFLLTTEFGIVVLVYLTLNLLYSFWLKHVPIIDVLVLASGYVLRVGAGVALITVKRFSPWLYVCTALLALFVVLGKRRAELVLLSDSANAHRKVLEGYSVSLLDQLLVIVSATTIVAYSLYTFSAENLPENHLMMLSIPFVIYGIFRYLLLVNVKNKGGAPEDVVLTDRPLMLTIILWGLFAVIVLYPWT